MSFALVATVGGVLLGGAKLVDGLIKNKNAKGKLEESQDELKKHKQMYANLDTTNPYLNMKNVYEDMTVNQQEARFARQQELQSQANIMQQFRGAAGSSGIAALAQSLANAGALGAQKSAVSIGKQEQAIQATQLKEDSRIQGLERQGEMLSRQMQASKTQGLLGMAAADVAADKAAMQAAQDQIWGGVGDIVGGVAFGATNQAFGDGSRRDFRQAKRYDEDFVKDTSFREWEYNQGK